MSLIYKYLTKSNVEKLNAIGRSIDTNPVFKHLLKCDSCLWKITFESTAYVPLDSKKIHCPVCKEKKTNSKIKIIS